jgi:hypothetical protein
MAKYPVQNLDTDIDSKVQYLDTLTSLNSFIKGNTTTVLIKDPIRGGIFNYFSTGYTVDNGIVFSATGTLPPTVTDLPSGYLVVWKNTGDGTIKTYVNDGGTIKSSVAFS